MGKWHGNVAIGFGKLRRLKSDWLCGDKGYMSKTCNTCGKVHSSVPASGYKLWEGGHIQFQCDCESTMMILAHKVPDFLGLTELDV